MFQFTGFATIAGRYVFNIPGCPIQTFTDQVSSADPRNFSQLGTSFFASESLGIPHTPLFIFFIIITQYYTRVISNYFFKYFDIPI